MQLSTKMDFHTALSIAWKTKYKGPKPSWPKLHFIYKPNFIFRCIYYILNPFDIVQKHSFVIKGVQTCCKVISSIPTYYNFFDFFFNPLSENTVCATVRYIVHKWGVINDLLCPLYSEEEEYIELVFFG